MSSQGLAVGRGNQGAAEPPSSTSHRFGKRKDFNFLAGARADAMRLAESMDHRGLPIGRVRLAVTHIVLRRWVGFNTEPRVHAPPYEN